MKSSEIRRTFLDYFSKNGHKIVSSSSLIPKNDPTLLFTNAGMVQFKDVFLGLEKRDYKRAVSSQKCVRAGGKHNDLENVGHTPRHHTFFEMLGNFSFGDYFKQDAIKYGWELLTEVYKLPGEHLWVTIYKDDDEAFDIWTKEMGFPTERLVRLGEKENFWAMGPTGPCGPCSEILLDIRPESTDEPTMAEDPESDRYLELWNLVFMQYLRDEAGELSPLPKPSIDTGMGLERISSVLQGVSSNYDTDLLRGIIAKVEEISQKTYGADEGSDLSMRVVADHSRSVTFLIADGVLPSNEGRGYVLRRILRRSVRHQRMLGIDDPCLFLLSEVVRDIMGEFYPELTERISFIQEVVRNEEKRFFETIDRGLELLENEVERHKGDEALPGDVVFKLYDTFGFPVDLTEDIAQESGLAVDLAGFNALMEGQRERSRESWKGSGEAAFAPLYKDLSSGGLIVDFTGYEHLEDEGRVVAIISEGGLVDSAEAGQTVELITDTTPFYGETGGQIGDIGTIKGQGGEGRVLDTQRPLAALTVHRVKVEKGTLWAGDKVQLSVDKKFRENVKAHHTATHMLHAVLREVLGTHVHQAGSLVSPEKLRFDFSHYSSIDNKTLGLVEEAINERLRWDDAVITEVDVPYDEAVKGGAMAIFEEKYGDRVRVVSIGDYSRELCGGTHVKSTGELGLVKLVHESSSAAGVRRVEALAGEQAWKSVKGQDAIIKDVSGMLKVPQGDLINRINKLIEENEELRKEISSVSDSKSSKQAADLLKQVKELNGVNLLTAEMKVSNPQELRKIWDDIKGKIDKAVVVLGGKSDERVFLMVGVTKGLGKQYHAGNIVKQIAEIVGGRGGGKPDLAQAGGTKPEKLQDALTKAAEIVAEAS